MPGCPATYEITAGDALPCIAASPHPGVHVADVSARTDVAGIAFIAWGG